jgi:hypothetical protein
MGLDYRGKNDAPVRSEIDSNKKLDKGQVIESSEDCELN